MKAATPEYFFREPRGLYGLSARCKDCRRAIRRAATWTSESPEVLTAKAKVWRAANLEKARDLGRKRYHRDRERNSAAALAYYFANKDKVREYNNRKYHSRPDHRVRVAMSTGIRKSIRDHKAGRSWESLAGYDLQALMAHLEKQFLPGMTWDNYGKWHIDHIRPVCSFAISEPAGEEFRACWALSNLQPLWARDNIAKGGRYSVATQ